MNLRRFHRHISAAALTLLTVMAVAGPASGASARDKDAAPGGHGRKASAETAGCEHGRAGEVGQGAEHGRAGDGCAAATTGTSEDGGPRPDAAGPPAHAGLPADLPARAGDVALPDAAASGGDDRPPAGQGGGRPDRPGPRGNNGTIKVVMEDTEQHPDNEPHGCLRGIDFYGFDDDQVLDVEFWMHPPTGRGLLFTVDDVVMVNGGNGSEPSRDTLLLVGVSSGVTLREMLDTTLAANGAERHPQQGYHVKVEAVDQSGRKVKSKVFWHDCPAPPPAGPKTVPPPVQPPTDVRPPNVVPPNTDVLPRIEVRPPAVQPPSEVPPAGLAAAVERPPAPAQTPAAERPTEVKGIEFQRGPLARTGSDPFGFAKVGLALVVAGLGAVAGSRRWRQEDFICIAERLSSY
jgi:hypothetical protein